MKKGFNYWKNLGLPKETVDAFSERVARHNLKMLCIESLTLGFLSILGAGVISFANYDYVKLIVLLVSGFVSLILFLVSRELQRNGSSHLHLTVYILIAIFAMNFYSEVIFLGVFNNESYAALIIGTILITQTSFAVLPIYNVAILLLGIGGFLWSDIVHKPVEYYYEDIMNVMVAAIMGLIISFRISKDKYEHEEAIELIERSNSSLYQSSLTDPLTGLLNRRNSIERLEVLAAQSSVSGKKIACLMMDIDFFKTFNDTYGHLEGDNLLKNLGKLLLDVQKNHSVYMSRIGGEEFMCFFTPKSDTEVADIANAILEGVRKLPHPDSDKGKNMTISIGIYENIAEKDDTGSRIYNKADRAVYEAKKNGRNRIEYYNTEFDQ